MREKTFSLRKKTILYCSVTLIALLSILLVFSKTIVTQGFERVEHSEAEKNIGRVKDALAMQIEAITVKFTDWSMWDDAYHYMENGNKEFEASSLADGPLLSMKVDFFIWRFPNGETRYAREYDQIKGEAKPLNPALVDFLKTKTQYFTFPKDDDRKQGIIDVPGVGLSFVTIQPIVHSDGKGPIVGSIFAGRVINKAMLDRLKELTHLDLDIKKLSDLKEIDHDFSILRDELKDPNKTLVKVTDETTVSGYAKIIDIFGEPLAYFRMQTPREIHAQGESTITSFIVMLSVAGIIFGIVIVAILEKNVISRVLGVSLDLTNLKDTNQLESRVRVSGNDEITALAMTANDLLDTIQKANELIEANMKNMKLIFDNAEQAFINIKLNGMLQGELSAVGTKWFPEYKGHSHFWDLVFAGDINKIEMYKLWWEQLIEGFMPFEVVAEQMPTRFVKEGEHFQIQLRQVQKDGQLQSILAVISNVSQLIKAEELEKEQREALRIFQALLSDKQAVLDFLSDSERRVQELKSNNSMTREIQMREIHTLKGNSAQLGLDTFAKFCHRLESKLLEEGLHKLEGHDLHALEGAWEHVKDRFNPLTSDLHHSHVQIGDEDISNVIELLNRQKPHQVISRILLSWLLEPVAPRLQRLAKVAEETSLKLGKEKVRTEVVDNGIRVDKEALKGIWGTIIHVIRNAVDHGIETPEERESLGKQREGLIQVSADAIDDMLHIIIADDGKGIDWEAIRKKAMANGLAHHTHQELIEALFSDGVSTKEEVSEMSGRGVGMAAVKSAVYELGGHIAVESVRGEYTRFILSFPRTQVEFCCDNEMRSWKIAG